MTIPRPLVYLLPLGVLLAILWIAASGERKPGSFRKRFAILVFLWLVAPVVLAASLSALAEGLRLGRIGLGVAAFVGFFTPWAFAAFLHIRWWVAGRGESAIKDFTSDLINALLDLLAMLPGPLRKLAGQLRNKLNRSPT